VQFGLGAKTTTTNAAATSIATSSIANKLLQGHEAHIVTGAGILRAWIAQSNHQL
jgi:hypothetical protein